MYGSIGRGLAVVSSICLLGCAAQMQKSKMEASLSPYVGRTIADYVLARGPPSNTVDMGPNRRGFQWTIIGMAPGAVLPLGGGLITVPPREQTCMVSFVASTNKPTPTLADWIIENWQWNGAC